MTEFYGQGTVRMVGEVFEEGAQRAVLLMRHSARTFDRTIHDLENYLTEEGRVLSQQFGAGLPKDLYLRGYASPVHRCMETAELTLEAHAHAGGAVGRTRPVEAFGVFYALDQQKMWKGLSGASNLASYVGGWFDGQVPLDAMMPANQAVQTLSTVLVEKLRQSQPGRSLDVCVTHDMTIFTMRHGLGLEPVSGPDVAFLDGLVVFERDGQVLVRSHHGAETAV